MTYETADISTKQEENWKENIAVTQVDEPLTWRLLKQKNDGKPNEELVFTIRGIMKSKSLPPLNAKPK